MRKHDPHAPQPGIDLLSQMGYESRDITLNTIVKWLSFLFIFIFIATVGTLGLYKLFVPAVAEAEHASALTTVRRVPPYPQLQADPKRDMMYYRRAEDAVVMGKTVDKATGRNDLSVEQAMNQLAEKGIAGITGSAKKTESQAYPGSGVYASGQRPADNGGREDTTDANGSGSNALKTSAPGAGGTGPALEEGTHP